MAVDEALKGNRNNLPVLVMFQDEARFGRLSLPQRCWAPARDAARRRARSRARIQLHIRSVGADERRNGLDDSLQYEYDGNDSFSSPRGVAS